MIALKSIINTFSLEEQQQFINYLKEKNKRSDIKNIQLFQQIIKDKDDKVICESLYKTWPSNAYHALRKRLLQSLIDFKANKNLADENSVDMQIIKYILASRSLLLEKNYTIAYKLLDKAEKLADEHLLYPILNEIYHTKIQYASFMPSINLDALIVKQNNNRKKHNIEDQLNIVYAKLNTILSDSIKQGQTINFENELEAILKTHRIELNDSLSFKSLYQILAIANISAFMTTNYFQIEAFVLKSYAILKQKKDTEKQLYYQIFITYIIANTLFRNKKFEISLNYIDEMYQLMQLKKGKYYKDFSLKYTLVKALNLNYSNQSQDAIACIEAVISKKHNDLEDLLDLHLTLVLFYLQQEDFKKAKKILAKLYHTDQWYTKKVGIDRVIKKSIIEILLYIEIEDDDLFDSRLKSFKRRYKSHLNDLGQQHMLNLLNYAELYQKKPEIFQKDTYKLKFKKLSKTINTQTTDIFILSMYAWLQGKINKTSVYKTTLKLLNKT